jgi:hypothetical protein
MVETELVPQRAVPLVGTKDIPVSIINLSSYDHKYKVVAQ